MRDSKSTYLYGPDSLGRWKRFKALARGRVFYLFETSWADILEEVKHPSLFSSSLVGIRILQGREEKVRKEDRDTIKEVIRTGAVISSEYSEKSELKRLLKELPCRMEYYKALYERERAALVREELARSGKEIADDALFYLVKTLGEDTLALWAEVEKLKHFPDERILLSHVEETVAPLREYPVWELEVALANRDYPRAWEVLEDLKRRGQAPQLVVGSLNYMIKRICRKDLSGEIFDLDWRVKMGYSPWDSIHLFVLNLLGSC